MRVPRGASQKQGRISFPKEKPRIITPGLLALNQWVLNYTACETILIIGRGEP